MANPPRFPPAVPRIHFSGRFLCDVSTVNNDPQHFDTAAFRSNYQLPYPLTDPEQTPNGWWNPEGTGSFALVSCTVSKAVYADGSVSLPTSAHPDPVLSLPIKGTDRTVQAKCVNLDPEQQGVFELWGLKVNLQSNDSNPLSLGGKLRPAACMDNWKKVPSSSGTNGDPHALGANAGVWQGVLELSEFVPGDSRFMWETKETLGDAKRVVIRMNVDAFTTDRTKPDFPYGRVVGTIRPWLSGDPLFFDADRQLAPVAPNPNNVFNAYAHVEERREGEALSGYAMYVDVGNALTLDSIGGPLTDIGLLYVCLLPGGDDIYEGPPPERLGGIDYLAEGWYESTAGIAQIEISREQAARAATMPVGLIAVQEGRQTLLCAEPDDGYRVRADQFVFRMNPDDVQEVTFYATKFGQRAPGTEISIEFDSTIMKDQATQGPIPGPQKVGEPTSAVKLESKTFVAGDNGVATLKITATPEGPGNPRGYIDGQVYGLAYRHGPTPPPVGQQTNTSEIVNLLVFDDYKIPENPSWLVDIAPIFLQYSQLYPAMSRIVNLADYASCMTRLYPLKGAFSAPIDDPHYMPVTRDLSKNKKKTILNWIGDPGSKTKPLYMDINSKENLMVALQTAIELEHSTIPPYLTALYSIKAGYNQFIADTLRGVVIEEMLHFSIACNILISIGGSPNINKPGFVPKYPGSLPGGLRRGLIVGLRKASIEQFRMFMSIEEPRSLVQTDDGKVTDEDLDEREEKELYTIGFFYDQIKKSLAVLHKEGKITFGNKDKQIEGWSNPGTLKKVLCLADAIAGINEIEEQGEGANPLNPTDDDIDPDTGLPELAHYYKFAEIVYGKRIILDEPTKHGAGRGFSYTGDPIVLDENGVYNMMDNPDIATLPVGSQQQSRAENFARRYQAVLNGLHYTFNGHPDYITQAIANMFQLTISAEPLMKLDSGKGDGTSVGLSFQLPIEK